jgi:hypothetical protein
MKEISPIKKSFRKYLGLFQDKIHGRGKNTDNRD